jgi:DNA helicase II / ATP-dependent DNA helicase PcrA
MKKGESQFPELYKGLNKAQKEAVDTIEGPVMVIAGPGTGKTQVLALRIANILSKTDTPADGVLCLTFTNSGVAAMKKRLLSYGIDPSRVVVSTFHAFGTHLIEEFFEHLDLKSPPVTMDEADAVGLFDEILGENDWKHLRPRGDAARYFRDLKSLISLLIRERLSPEDFNEEIEKEIKRLSTDPDNISSRGATKGELKREVQNKIESLERTREAVTFYELYEERKKSLNVFDYDDILRAMVRLVTEFEDVRATLRERHLYVLVDEHQDSSGVQNEFLKTVWGPVEKPNVFVVGDDRQLIYGFSGASLSLFEEFKENFPGTKLITLTENYRSTQKILDMAENLLQSALAKGKLSSNQSGNHPIGLIECAYPRDEVLRAALFFKEKIDKGLEPEECVLLVPKNAQVRAAVRVLEDTGLPVSAPNSLHLFESSQFESFFRVLKIINNPMSHAEIAESLLDPLSKFSPLEAHQFIYKTQTRNLTVNHLVEEGFEWGRKLSQVIEWSQGKSAYEVIQYAGQEFLLNPVEEHNTLVLHVEVIRTLLHLALTLETKSKDKRVSFTLSSFINYIHRLREYGEDIPLAIFGEEKGVRVMTLHSSKGLEFEAVWIAHMNERSLMGGKSIGLTLPERLKVLEEKKDEMAARREVYVALTRAKSFANISYSQLSYSGREEELARVVDDLSREEFVFEDKSLSEEKLLKSGVTNMVVSHKPEIQTVTKKELQKLVKEEFSKKKVSATTLNNFYDCSWKWYFRSFLGVPEPEPEAMTFGSVVHKAIENLIKLGNLPKEKQLKEAIEEALDSQHVYEEKARRRMTTEALRALKRFVSDLLPDLYEERETERALSVRDKRFPELTITGKIDLMEHDGGGSVRVTDFKTGRPRSTREIEKENEEGRLSGYLRQLAFYSYLLNSSSKGRFEVSNSRLYFVESDDSELSLYETAISEEKLNLLIQDIKDYQELLLSGKWVNRECEHKAYPGEPECPYCKRAEMYK